MYVFENHNSNRNAVFKYVFIYICSSSLNKPISAMSPTLHLLREIFDINKNLNNLLSN